MLSRSALNISSWKKSIAWFLYQKRDLERASLLHATSLAEADDCRARGMRVPIAIIPNGVACPSDLPFRSDSRDSSRTLLFLSRLHPIKGLSDLVHAWAQIRPKGWRVIVAGPDERNHRHEIEALAEVLGVRGDFDFYGPIFGAAKWELYRSADIFVLPSLSENFGLAIGEALGAGLPVITTQATPWQEIAQYGCGWWIPTGADSLATTLRSAMTASDQQLREMGERGQSLIRTHYSWSQVARRMRSVFEWLLNLGPKPDCIVS